MRSLCRLASFAALVVGSSVALFADAQATTLNVGSGSNNITSLLFAFWTGEPGTLNMSFPPLGPAPASFPGLDGGSIFFADHFDPASMKAQMGVSGFDPATNLFNTISDPGGGFSVSFPGGNDLSGQIFVRQIADSPTSPTLSGVFQISSSSGSLVNDFGGPGSSGQFSFSLALGLDGVPNCTPTCTLFQFSNLPLPPPSLFGALIYAQGSGDLTPTNIVPPVPLPGAIYLFGSVLAGAFWLGRRKRTSGAAVAV
jgi:hypothetical protein